MYFKLQYRIKMLAATMILSLYCPPMWAAGENFVVLPENQSTISVLRNSERYLDIEFTGWGPNWSWMGWRGEVQEKDNATRLVGTSRVSSSGAEINLVAEIRQTGPRQLKLNVNLRTSNDTDLTYIVASITMADRQFKRGRVIATLADGSSKEVKLPLDKRGLGDALHQFALVDTADNATRMTLDPPRDVASDGAIRLILAGRRLEATRPSETGITIDFPADLTYFAGSSAVPSEPGFEDWYQFRPSDDYSLPTEIGMQDWLEKPAGKHGRIKRDRDQLVYDGKPIKLWGLNLCYGTCAPEKELAEKRAQFYAHYGINAVRLHKYADGSGWAGIQSEESFVELEPAGLDRMDYQVAQFKQHGIYVKLSAHFGSQKLGPGDKKYVPYLEEFGSFSDRTNRITTPHSAVHYSPELQDVQIRQMVNLLKHKNPYTGLTYAEDPAVAFLEIINEQSILFFSSMNPFKASPTLRRYVGKRFCQWLRERYATHARLEQAWGGKSVFDSFQNDGFRRRWRTFGQGQYSSTGKPLVLGSAATDRHRRRSANSGCWTRCCSSFSCRTSFTSDTCRPCARPDTRVRSSPQIGRRVELSAISQPLQRRAGGHRRPPQLFRWRQPDTHRQLDHAGVARFRDSQFGNAAGGGSAVHALRVDSCDSERMGRRGARHYRCLRHGTAGLGCLLHVSEPGHGCVQRVDWS